MSPFQEVSAGQVMLSRQQSKSTASKYSGNSDLEKQDGPVRKSVASSGNNLDRIASHREGAVVFNKKLKWWEAGFYMIAYNISIGILALPKAFSNMGLAGSLIFILPYALINYWTSLIIGVATRRYGMYNYPDLLGLTFGPWGKVVGHSLQFILQFFLMAVHSMAMRKALVAVTTPHSIGCGVWATFAGAVLMFACCLYRQLKESAWLAIVSTLSILVATIITMVSVISNSVDVDSHYFLLPDSIFSTSSLGSGVASVVFAFTGHLAYPQIVNEMEKPGDFKQALIMNAIFQVVMYTITGSIVYWFAGDFVKAPALDSATGLLVKLAYGLAIPTIVVAGFLPGSFIIKSISRGIWHRMSWPGNEMEASWKAKGTWFVIALGLWTLAPIFAEVVPSFMGVVGVAGAFLGAWISLGLPVMIWLRMDQDLALAQRRREGSDTSREPIVDNGEPVSVWTRFWCSARVNARRHPKTALFNVFLLVLGSFLCVFGAYGAIADMVNTRHTAEAMRPFACGAPAALKNA